MSTCICENSKYLNSIIDNSVNVCEEIINVTNSVSTNVIKAIPTNATNTISKNVTSTGSTDFHNKAIYRMGCYNLRTVLLVTILVSINPTICYHLLS